MANIFISYRRDDSADISGRMYDRLVQYYGAKTVFKDVNSLRGGQRFPAKLENAITEETIMLLVIGQRWLPITSERHNDPFDFGRVEIEIALRQHATIIPVLVQGAAMPTRNELPPSIADLANLHAVNVRSDPDFVHDVDTLRQAINLFYRAPRRSFPWIATISGTLLVAILG